MKEQGRPEMPNNYDDIFNEGSQKKERRSIVGGKEVITYGDRNEHFYNLREERLRQRTPEQLKLIEERRFEFTKALNDFRNEALDHFEEHGDMARAAAHAIASAFSLHIDERDLF